MDYGFVRVAAAVPEVRVADAESNVRRIAALMAEADERGVQLTVFPELSVTGYTCGDLFGQQTLIEAAENALGRLVDSTAGLGTAAVVGMPLRVSGRLYNTAVVFGSGHIYGVVPKINIPNYGEFYEARWFTSGRDVDTQITLCGRKVRLASQSVFECGNVHLGVEICEDLWVADSPSIGLALGGANIIANLSATDEVASKHDYLENLIKVHSSRTHTAYIYASAGSGESSTDLAFTGNGMIAENGSMLAASKRFVRGESLTVCDIDTDRLNHERLRQNTFRSTVAIEGTPIALAAYPDDELLRVVEAEPFVPQDASDNSRRCGEIFAIQRAGLVQRLDTCGIRASVVGISGGLDSTLALLVTVAAYDLLERPRTDITGITMPGFGTTDRTHDNAVELMRSLGVSTEEITIDKACLQHFRDIGLSKDDRSVTYENSQARERTQILMDYANRKGGIVIGTGDLSELALGWATYNGDHMSMYGVNAGVPKTLVRHLVRWYADTYADDATKRVLLDVLDTPISPELLPADEKAQLTEDLVGPYELHDFFLYYTVRWGYTPEKVFKLACKAFGGRYEEQVVAHWYGVFARRFFAQQFKRSAMPDGVKVGSISLSPRGDWRMPSDASGEEWLRRIEEL